MAKIMLPLSMTNYLMTQGILKKWQIKNAPSTEKKLFTNESQIKPLVKRLHILSADNDILFSLRNWKERKNRIVAETQRLLNTLQECKDKETV